MQVVGHPIVFGASNSVYVRAVRLTRGARRATSYSGQEGSEQPAGVARQALPRGNQVKTA